MASRKAFVIDTDEPFADGVVQSLDKQNIGLAWQNDGPTAPYITIELKEHWIITDEDYKLLKQAKKDAKDNNRRNKD